jgi:tRNA(fMet)-specific endonuclease VapC
VGPLYLLDTNVLVHFVRDSRVWRLIQQRYSLLVHDPRPVFAVVSIGEVRSLALQFGWQARKQSQAAFIVGYFRPLTIDNDRIHDAYAEIDFETRRIGRSMGKNDLWIAATARVFDAVILTTDRDFDHLAPAFVHVEWIDPTLPTSGTP